MNNLPGKKPQQLQIILLASTYQVIQGNATQVQPQEPGIVILALQKDWITTTTLICKYGGLLTPKVNIGCPPFPAGGVRYEAKS